MERYLTGTGQPMTVHDKATCLGEYCVIHHPMPGFGSDWPTHWRGDDLFDIRRLMERICPHGVGHPAREQYDYWIATGQLSAMAPHGGCMTCCPEYCYGGLLVGGDE